MYSQCTEQPKLLPLIFDLLHLRVSGSPDDVVFQFKFIYLLTLEMKIGKLVITLGTFTPNWFFCAFLFSS